MICHSAFGLTLVAIREDARRAGVTSVERTSRMPRAVLCRAVLAAAAARFFFVVQAEDGIRDVAVTGVQTCALPICASSMILWSSSAEVFSPDKTPGFR